MLLCGSFGTLAQVGLVGICSVLFIPGVQSALCQDTILCLEINAIWCHTLKTQAGLTYCTEFILPTHDKSDISQSILRLI